ncbi:unnamed protein product, partial [Scytosiphon promiscuus]
LNNNLRYLFQGDHKEAEILFRRSMSIQEKALGPEHPSVGRTLYTLAGLLESQVNIHIFQA